MLGIQNRTALEALYVLAEGRCSSSIQRTYTFRKIYLFRLLWTSVIITSVQGSGKVMFLLFLLYLFTSISTFCPTRHFFFIGLTINSHFLSLFLCVSPIPCSQQRFLHLVNSIYIPKNHPAGSRGDETIAEVKMKEEPCIFFPKIKRATGDQVPINKHCNVFT